MRRVTLGGLADFPSAGLDHRVKVFFPLPGEPRPLYPKGDDWWERWQAEPVRAVFRTYTIRRHRPEQGGVDIDFVLHGDGGSASQWAIQAAPGDEVGLWGPRAEYAPPAGTDWVLLAGDETALPAIGALIESMRAHAQGRVLVEVASAAEEQRFDLPDGVRLDWLQATVLRADGGDGLQGNRGRLSVGVPDRLRLRAPHRRVGHRSRRRYRRGLHPRPA